MQESLEELLEKRLIARKYSFSLLDLVHPPCPVSSISASNPPHFLLSYSWQHAQRGQGDLGGSGERGQQTGFNPREGRCADPKSDGVRSRKSAFACTLEGPGHSMFIRNDLP
eukprot:729046-Hanusia_phi.AAC.8